MANILLRSPYYETPPAIAGSTTAQLQLTIAGSLKYTISKNVDSSGSAIFEICELARDYININFYGAYLPQTTSVSGNVVHYDDSGTALGVPYTFSHRAFDGYSYFQEGSNITIPSNSLLQSNTIVYVPENTVGVIPSEFSGDIKYNTFTTTATSITVGTTVISINRVCEPKYNPLKVTFINKFGALQDIWFFKKDTKNITISKEKYNRSTINSFGTYSTNKHQKRTLSAIGNESMTVNTGFIDEGLNNAIKELLISEQVWTTIEGQVLPIDISTDSLTYKKSVNDKLINYTIEFNFAFDAINNIR
tara:strand:+ start:693 stop:1610 length:918 start_codon:yes stop_codon:yes gene_type:complete